MWNTAQYLKFSNERSRPFFDLMSQVRAEEALSIVDLGCGPGNMTLTLSDRWPQARVLGVDSSPEMLTQAVPLSVPGRLEFEQADIAGWSPRGAVDLIVSNAALHWVPDHAGQLARLVGMLTPGGTLAVQMPNRFHTASHVAVEETTADPRWAPLLANVGLHRESVLPLASYIGQLHDLKCTVNAWETIYHHVMTGDNPVLEWLKGTALRPILEKLPDGEKGPFQAALAERLGRAYPARQGITVFPMPRVFFVAQRN